MEGCQFEGLTTNLAYGIIYKMVERVDIYDIKRLNEEKGFYFFSPDTTRFFRSRYPQCAFKVGDKAYFITSERFDHEPRGYTIRVCDLITGDITEHNPGEFNKLTYSQATYKLQRLLCKLSSPDNES